MVKFSENQKEKMIEWAKKRIKKDEEFDPQTVDWEQEIFTGKERIEEVWTLFRNYIKERYDVIEEWDEDEYLHYIREGREDKERRVLESIDEPPEIDVNRAMEEIENYTYKGKQFTYSTLLSLINQSSVVNNGQVGCGKTRSSKDLVEMLDIPKVIVQVGHLTAKSFYRFIEANKDCIIILDEADMLLSNHQINQMIKTMLSNGELAWKTDRENLETGFDGALIVNCNEGKFDRCITDKVIENNAGFSTDEFKAKIKQSRNYEPDEEVWDRIRQRIMYTKKDRLKLSQEMVEQVYDFIYDLNYIGSFRDKQRIFDTFEGLKNLFGGMDRKIFKLGKELAENSLGGSRLDKVISSVPRNKKIDRKEVKEKIANALGVSTRQANNKIRELIEAGKMESPKRGTVIKP